MPWPTSVPVPREVQRIRPREGDVIVFRFDVADHELVEGASDEIMASMAEALGRDVRILVMATNEPVEITAVASVDLPDV